MEQNQSKYKNYFKVDEKTVFGFFEDFRFLSNYEECAVEYNGVAWRSSEHAYMVGKCKDVSCSFFDCKNINQINHMTCHEVRKWGQTVALRDDWEQIKRAVMLQINLDKYVRNPELREKLIATGDRELVESNHWGDSYWGWDIKNGSGQNHLGKILMMVRGILR